MADETLVSGKRLFSCALCYQQKRGCDKGTPCSHCTRLNVTCAPSPLETTNRPRKRRFPEAELLSRIQKYEAALIAYGANLEAIQSSSEAAASSKSGASQDLAAADSTSPDDVTASFLGVLDGKDEGDETGGQAAQTWYDDIFAQDDSATLFALDPEDVQAHPSPFDIFKLWQVYCDNVHPISKIVHAPTFQRKIPAFGSHLYLASAADQSLFFAVYTAALTSMSSLQCEVTFNTSGEVMLEQYKAATQVWLQRAGLWRTSDLTVLQAYVVFLVSIQNVVDPRTLACFTGVADRIARRMGLHRDLQSDVRPLDREMRTRVWWEMTLIDAKAIERAGLGTSITTGHWDARLPSRRSDAHLEKIEGVSFLEMTSQPSSEMICFLIRAEVALFIAELHNERAGKYVNSIDYSNLTSRLKSIDAFERRLHSQYICFCDDALPPLRLAVIFAQASLSRARISAYIVEDSSKAAIGIELNKHCTQNLEAYRRMRNDISLEPFKWFVLQSLPVFAYINLLRLLQVYVSGDVVDQAWQALQSFKGAGPRRVADALTLKAWRARTQALSNPIDEPAFITEIHNRALLEPDASLANSMSESDMMALMAELLSSEVYSPCALTLS